jgi:membrane protease YdiL (CAAX protease family)
MTVTIGKAGLQTTDFQTHADGQWSIVDALIVGLLGYGAGVIFLLLSIFVVRRNLLGFRSYLMFYQVDSSFYLLVGLASGVLFAWPFVTWTVRRRRLTSLKRSISWDCNHQTAVYASLVGVVLGVAYSLARSTLAGRGFSHVAWLQIAAFALLTGLASPVVEEIYFRGILFVALEHKLGNIPSIVAVTVLFCVAHPQHWFIVLPIAILLSAVRLHTNSVKACVLCHAAYNLSLALFMLQLGG